MCGDGGGESWPFPLDSHCRQRPTHRHRQESSPASLPAKSQQTAAERLEVESIAVCWLRRKRILAYENSQIARERIPLEERRLRLMNPRAAVADSPLWPSHITLNLLRKAEAEIAATGKISDELNAEMAGTTVVVFQQVWARVKEQAAKELGQFAEEASPSKVLAPGDSECSAGHLLCQIQIAITRIDNRIRTMVDDAAQASNDSVAVLRTEVLDRILRAEAAAERQLNCAIFRLVQLQLRRKEQAVPPPVKGLAR
jgi:hypothetical protein